MMDEVAKKERSKYEKVWSHDEYRRHSPGMMEAQSAFAMMGMHPYETVNDYGSGPARATKFFEEKGLHAIGIDLAENAAETDVPIFHVSLWDMVGHVPGAHYGFCCDVMEHIPPEKGDAVLKQIAHLTNKACYFRIATRPDVMGPRLLGEPLHLTIKDAEWWLNRIGENFHEVEVVRQDPRDLVCIARHATSAPAEKADDVVDPTDRAASSETYD